MKVAIIDDDFSFMEKLKMDLLMHFDTFDEDVIIDTFTDPEKVSKYYNLYFFDIDFNGDNGIAFASKIKSENRDCYIIFVSAKSDLVFESLLVIPFHFIRKLNYEVDLQMFYRLFDDEFKYNVVIPLRYRSNRTQILLSDIMYIESHEHLLTYHTKDRTYEDGRPLKEVLKLLPKELFIQVHQSYIINIHYLNSFRKDVITMIDGTMINIGSSHKKKFYSFYQEYLTR